MTERIDPEARVYELEAKAALARLARMTDMRDPQREFYDLSASAKSVRLAGYVGQARDVCGGTLVFLPGVTAAEIAR